MGQYVFGTLDELDAFGFWTNHGLNLEKGLLLKVLQIMYVYSPYYYHLALDL